MDVLVLRVQRQLQLLVEGAQPRRTARSVGGLLGEAVQLHRTGLPAAVSLRKLRCEAHADVVECLAEPHVGGARLLDYRLGEADKLRLGLRRPAVDGLELGTECHPRRRALVMHLGDAVHLHRERDPVLARLVNLVAHKAHGLGEVAAVGKLLADGEAERLLEAGLLATATRQQRLGRCGRGLLPWAQAAP